jgi:hypothetical protein
MEYAKIHAIFLLLFCCLIENKYKLFEKAELKKQLLKALMWPKLPS